MLGLDELGDPGFEPFEVVFGFYDPRFRVYLQVQRLGSGKSGFLRAGQRRGGKVNDVRPLRDAGSEVVREHLGHLPAAFGEVEFGQPAVKNAVGVVDLAMAEQMDSCLGHVYQFLKEGGRSEIFYIS
jgi:hypothetical protein